MRTVSRHVGAPAYRFGNYTLDRRTLELHKAGARIGLALQPARVLRLLLSRPGALVTREELCHALWGEGTFVDFERNLNYCLSRVRDALDDDPRAPRYVETLARRGYRFIARVETDRPGERPTLAVLPFANLDASPSGEAFADGLTDAIITELAHVRAVRVISRQSVLHLKGSRQTLEEIACELDVDGVVEGTVLHAGSSTRVTAQLVLLDPERHAWAESYDCDTSILLTTLNDVGRRIAASVGRAIGGRDCASPRPRRTHASA